MPIIEPRPFSIQCHLLRLSLLILSFSVSASSVPARGVDSVVANTSTNSAVKPWGHHYIEKMEEGIWRGTQPRKKELRELKAQGVKTIIDIRMLGPDIWRERHVARKMGFRYYNFPMSVLRVKDQKVQRILEIMQDPAQKPVFLHCRFGGDRAASLLGIYRMLVNHWSYKQAYVEMRQHHFIPLQYLLKRAVRRYIPDRPCVASTGETAK